MARGLGTRSRVELTLTEQGLAVVRPGAQDFFVPAAALRGARLDKGIAGKVLAEGGLLVVTWRTATRRSTPVSAPTTRPSTPPGSRPSPLRTALRP
ncbi:hypothetical protein GCM10020221_04330 [Streptomyces thioluteus]|uniref:PH domain-containing protein n=1 Tax=Streptomyces thioluteus TaxID=66431 RepID=A0ABN3WD33_STRTU